MAAKKKGTIVKPSSAKKSTQKKTGAKKSSSRKKTAKKSVSKKSSAARTGKSKTTMSPADAEIRLQMIAEAAYFLSVQRSPDEGSAQEDWLTAEAQVDQKLTR